MRKIVATLLVGAALALLNVTGAFAASDGQNRIFFGDGFTSGGRGAPPGWPG